MTPKNRIKSLRESASLSQGDLAKAVGVSQQAISFYEKGAREPKLETWQKMADVFGVSVSYLQGLTANPTRDGEATPYQKAIIECLWWAYVEDESFGADYFSDFAKIKSIDISPLTKIRDAAFAKDSYDPEIDLAPEQFPSVFADFSAAILPQLNGLEAKLSAEQITDIDLDNAVAENFENRASSVIYDYLEDVAFSEINRRERTQFPDAAKALDKLTMAKLNYGSIARDVLTSDGQKISKEKYQLALKAFEDAIAEIDKAVSDKL